MPWCDECDRFYNPNSLPEGGRCPGCGHKLHVPRRGVEPAVDHDRKPVPWHFWVLVVAFVIYLGWRIFQGIAWVANKL